MVNYSLYEYQETVEREVTKKEKSASTNQLKTTVGCQHPDPPSEEGGTRSCFAFIQESNAYGEDNLCSATAMEYG